MPALIDIARWTILFLICVALAIAGASDVRSRRIPNWTVLAIAGLFCAWYFVGRPAVPILSSLGGALIVFAGSCALYSFGIIGAGDSKLATIVALFAGIARLPEYILYMSVTGGVLVLCMLAAQPARALVIFQVRGKGGLDRGVPYGVAIAVAGAMLLLPAVTQQLR